MPDRPRRDVHRHSPSLDQPCWQNCAVAILLNDLLILAFFVGRQLGAGAAPHIARNAIVSRREVHDSHAIGSVRLWQ